MSNIAEKLSEIQKKLNAPKSQYNKFGDFYFRNVEDIQGGLKPLLDGVTVTVADDILEAGGNVYVKATATITDGKDSISSTAYARENFNKKGMDPSQMTGSATSYARKYALGGLLLVDDMKDADSPQPSMEDVLIDYKSMSRDQQLEAWNGYSQEVQDYISENF